MNILALETTGKYGSAAVIRDDGAIFSAGSSNEMNHLRDVITISDEAISAAGISKHDLTHVAASIGPGSFTGIRIGVTTARTLGQFLEIPCIGVSSLRGLAERAAAAALAGGAGYIAAIINARRHQTYAGVWKVQPGSEPELIPFMPERQYMIEDLLSELGAKSCGAVTLFTGDGVDAYGSIISGTLDETSYILACEDIRYQDASSVAKLALARAKAGETLDYEELMPEYMRLSEAEQRLREGTLSDKIKRASGR